MEVHFETNILYQVLTCFLLEVTIEILSIWVCCCKSERETFYFSYIFIKMYEKARKKLVETELTFTNTFHGVCKLFEKTCVSLVFL